MVALYGGWNGPRAYKADARSIRPGRRPGLDEIAGGGAAGRSLWPRVESRQMADFAKIYQKRAGFLGFPGRVARLC
jgi:hypothetical protein